MIIKVENINPKITYMTCNGNRTPKEIWKDTETGVTGMRKRDVIEGNKRMERLGITPDMTEEEARIQFEKYLENNKEGAL